MGTQLTTRAGALVAAEDETPIPASTNYLAVLVVSAILVVAHVPMLIALAKELWSRPHYQFFVIIPFFMLLLGYVGLLRLPGPVRAGNQLLCIGMVMLSAFLLVLSSLIGSGTGAALATIVTLLAAIYGVGGWVLLKHLWPAVLMMAPAIPPPGKLDEYIITELQRWVAAVNGKVLDVFGAIHMIKGAGIEIPGKQLMVEEQCSGIHSFFALLTLTLLLLLLFRRGVVHSIILLAAAVYWVLLANLARVYLCTASEYYFRYDLADDSYGQHSALSMGMFGLAALLVFCTDRVLLFFSPRARRRTEEVIPSTAPWVRSPLELFPDLNSCWLSSWAIGVLFAGVATLQFWIVGKEIAGELTRPDLNIRKVGENALPAKLPGAARMNYRTEKRNVGNINGEFSQSWGYYVGGKHRCEVSLDYTFTGWHELTTCYRNGGWLVKDRKVLSFPEDPSQQFVRVDLEKRHLGLNGFLLFSVWDDRGERINPPLSSTNKLLRERLDTIWNKLRGESVNRMTAPTYQVQVFVHSYGELSEPEKQLMVQLFRDVEARMKAIVQEHKTDLPKEEIQKEMQSPPRKTEGQT